MDSNKKIYPVSELTFEVRKLLEASYPNVWVEGEISNLARPRSGHLYFSLKDEKAQVRCAFFRNRMTRLKDQPEDGMKVRIKAQISLYENRGDFQLIVTHLEKSGLGDLQAAFEKLKHKLDVEGLFKADYKKPLPAFPKTIAIITSATGAAVKDIISTVERRYPALSVLLYPVQVQGEKAASEIAAMIKRADQDNLAEILIVGRGGGSLEDLWAFNEEIVARAIFNCHTPVISAVGHEIDFSIADFVADMRAPTPTAASELATPDGSALLQQLSQTQSRLVSIMNHRLINLSQKTDILTRRVIHPKDKVSAQRELVRQLSQRLTLLSNQQLERCKQQTQFLTQKLYTNSPKTRLITLNKHSRNLSNSLIQQITYKIKLRRSNLNSLSDQVKALSPQATLERGYAIVTEPLTKQVIKSAIKIQPGEKIQVQLRDGQFDAIKEK